MKKFIRFVVFGFIFVMIGVASINIFIDPFDLMPFSMITGIVKEEAIPQMRFFRALEIIRKKPKAILFGSSRVMFGCSAEDLEKSSGMPCRNLAFPSARMEEIFAYFQHALYHQPDLKLVVLGIDFFAFNKTCQFESDYDPTLLSSDRILWKFYWKSLFTTEGFSASARTLKLYLQTKRQGSTSHLAEKVFGVPENLEAFKIRERLSLRNYFLKPNTYGKFSLSKKAIDQFHQMASICKERNIELKVFICPCHALYWQGVYLKDLWHDLEGLKRELVKSVPVWDFSGCNGLSSDSFLNSYMTSAFFDHNHFRRSIGNEIFETIFLKHPNRYAQLINQETCEESLKQLYRNQMQWAEYHSEDLAFLKQSLSM